MRLEVILSVILNIISFTICDKKSLFSVSKRELEYIVSNREFTKIRNVLKYEGAFAVTELSSEYTAAVRDLVSSAPQCLFVNRYPEFILSDGSVRTTFASETEEYPECLSKTGSTISHEFNNVFADVSQLFELLAGKDSLKWRPLDGAEPKKFKELPKKEHIHVYQRSKAEHQDFAAPFHTDNGVLLLITPFQEHPLQVKTVGGLVMDTSSVGEDALIVLIARGLPDWLLRGTRESLEFTAAPHAVQTLPGDIQYRTVFARMMVAPLEAVPGNDKAQKLRFEEVFFNQDGAQHGQLCMIEHAASAQLSRIPRAHHSHNGSEVSLRKLTDDHGCDEGTAAYCWMNCLDLPTCPTQDTFKCTDKEEIQCCTADITEDCLNMETTCAWKCNAPSPSPANQFCNNKIAGLDMYMTGFEMSSVGQAKNNCIVLLFQAWVLDSRLKFAFGCIGVILLGIGVEGLLCVRRLLQSRKILRRISSPVRRVSIILLFGLNIAFGYLAMLVAMTYSVELFLCMVVGLVLGHAIFNTAAPVGESVDPCCASQRDSPLINQGRACENCPAPPLCSHSPARSDCEQCPALPRRACEECPALQRRAYDHCAGPS